MLVSYCAAIWTPSYAMVDSILRSQVLSNPYILPAPEVSMIRPRAWGYSCSNSTRCVYFIVSVFWQSTSLKVEKLSAIRKTGRLAKRVWSILGILNYFFVAIVFYILVFTVPKFSFFFFSYLSLPLLLFIFYIQLYFHRTNLVVRSQFPISSEYPRYSLD